MEAPTATGREARRTAEWNYKQTLTNPVNGLSVIDSIAISETLPIVSGVESGVHTHLVSVHGVPEKLQVPAGGVLTRDAGNLTFSLTYDANDKLVASELVSVKGPHAGFGTNAWCDVATVALGL